VIVKMSVQEGLIWTYYDCSNACFLFGKFELPCFFALMLNSLFALFLIALLLFFLNKFRRRNKK